MSKKQNSGFLGPLPEFSKWSILITFLVKIWRKLSKLIEFGVPGSLPEFSEFVFFDRYGYKIIDCARLYIATPVCHTLGKMTIKIKPHNTWHECSLSKSSMIYDSFGAYIWFEYCTYCTNFSVTKLLADGQFFYNQFFAKKATAFIFMTWLAYWYQIVLLR